MEISWWECGRGQDESKSVRVCIRACTCVIQETQDNENEGWKERREMNGMQRYFVSFSWGNRGQQSHLIASPPQATNMR